MSTDLQAWDCNKCPFSVLVPWEELSPREYADVLMRIREHRFAHLVSALETANDEELMRMSGDEDEETPDYGPVLADDAEPILEGIEKMLRGARGG